MSHESVVVEADGGSRGNPGPAGFGAVVMDATTREVLAERSESIGIATNNVAEYRGLIAGLTAALEVGAVQVAVRMDSKLVVEQMSGRWQVKHPDMRPLAREANELRRKLDEITFEWIPRELNKHADRLANEAMDAAAGISRRRVPKAAPPVQSVIKPSTADLAGRVRQRALLRGEFTLRSGQVSDHYFDKYLLEADPAMLGELAEAMVDLVPADADVLAGLELGGVPLATVLSQLTGTPSRFIRKVAKEYGTAQQIEGGSVDGRLVVLVEDVITSGGAVLDAIEAVRAAGGVVERVVCLIDRQQGGRAALTGKGVAVAALFTAADLE
ncbi:MAG: orotate phosphoribosyltransferase [Jatrophihabitans sp.]